MLNINNGNIETARIPRAKTLLAEVYIRLRDDIIQGKYPPGARLRVEHLKDIYKASAGTLREALSLLVSDSLVSAEEQRGFSVTPLSLADLDDLTSMRILLETEALRQSLRKGNDDWEADLVAAYYRLTKVERRPSPAEIMLSEWELRNKEFHDALIKACDSRWLLQILRLLYRQAERYRHLAVTKSTMKRNLHAEHEEIFHAALNRNEKRATEALVQHIDLTRQAIHSLAPSWMRG